jgi:outer membrane lipoprotein carrier protein
MTYVLSRKPPFLVMCVMLALPVLVQAQNAQIVSADKFFADLSAAYGTVKDYEASFGWTQGKSVSHGRISYKSPFYLRLDFTSPANQVLNFDGEKLTFYSPSNEIILEQKYRKRSSSQLEGMVTSQGLNLWSKNYSIAYLTGAAEVPLDEGAPERVVKLKLVSRAATSYSQMILSIVKSTMLIRRVEGFLTSGEKVVLDFTSIRTNQGVPDSRFVYDGPAGAFILQDWLFDPEQ